MLYLIVREVNVDKNVKTLDICYKTKYKIIANLIAKVLGKSYRIISG